MKKNLVLLTWLLSVFPLMAQTNFDILFCNDAIYTNVTIIRRTPAYVVVDHSEGISKVYMSNLPAILQEAFHYNPEDAAQTLAAEKKKEADLRAATAAQALARQKYLASLAGETEYIRVDSAVDQQLMGDLTCVISNSTGSSTVLISGLPNSVVQYIRKKEQLVAQIEYQKNRVISFTSTVSDPNDPDPLFTAQMNAQAATDAAEEKRREKIGDLKEELRDLKDEAEKGMVRAYPTGLNYYQMPIWQCGESGK
jgi:hypothetical protein